MSHATARWGLVVPDEGDGDDVPTWLDQLAQKLDVTIAGFAANTWANRPQLPADLIEGLLFWATDQGSFYLVQGGTLHALSITFGGTGSVTTAAFGDAPAAGTPGNGAAPIDHRHGMPANPVTAHVAAGDPHPVYALDTDLTALLVGVTLNSSPRYTRSFLLMGA